MPAVDVDGLAGDEIAVRRAEKDHRPYEVLRILVSLKRAFTPAVLKLLGRQHALLLRA